MGKYLIILLLCFPALSFGQGFAALGNGNPLDTARILNNYFLPMKAMRFPAYAPSAGDTNFVSTISGGRVYGYSLNSFLSRIGSYVGVPTLQQVLNSGSNLSGNNTIGVGNGLTFSGTNLNFAVANSSWSGQITVLDNPITYIADFAPFNGKDVPDYAAVQNYVRDGYFDTTMSTTVTALTSPRFSRTVNTINYGGLTYNSEYFTQVGTTLTFIGLIFYNGQKLTFTLK